jgi:hypothetical protein
MMKKINNEGVVLFCSSPNESPVFKNLSRRKTYLIKKFNGDYCRPHIFAGLNIFRDFNSNPVRVNTNILMAINSLRTEVF